MGFCALFEVNHGILCIFRRSSWDIVHYLKSIMGFCAFSEDPREILCLIGSSSGILCIFGSSSYNFVHFWKFLMGFCAFLEFPHGKAYTCPFHPFTFSLQDTCFCNIHTDGLRLSLTAISSKRHPVITNIRVTRQRLMQRRRIATFVWRRCPSLGLSQIIFMIWYDFSHIFYFNNFYCK